MTPRAMEPRTPSGVRFAARLNQIGRSSQDTSFPTAEEDIAEVESEARLAALQEVGEAVIGLHRPSRSDVNFRAVLAAISALREKETNGE